MTCRYVEIGTSLWGLGIYKFGYAHLESIVGRR